MQAGDQHHPGWAPHPAALKAGDEGQVVTDGEREL
jgi:hypothetical protein